MHLGQLSNIVKAIIFPPRAETPSTILESWCGISEEQGGRVGWEVTGGWRVGDAAPTLHPPPRVHSWMVTQCDSSDGWARDAAAALCGTPSPGSTRALRLASLCSPSRCLSLSLSSSLSFSRARLASNPAGEKKRTQIATLPGKSFGRPLSKEIGKLSELGSEREGEGSFYLGRSVGFSNPIKIWITSVTTGYGFKWPRLGESIHPPCPYAYLGTPSSHFYAHQFQCEWCWLDLACNQLLYQ